MVYLRQPLIKKSIQCIPPVARQFAPPKELNWKGLPSFWSTSIFFINLCNLNALHLKCVLIKKFFFFLKLSIFLNSLKLLVTGFSISILLIPFFTKKLKFLYWVFAKLEIIKLNQYYQSLEVFLFKIQDTIQLLVVYLLILRMSNTSNFFKGYQCIICKNHFLNNLRSLVEQYLLSK